MASRGADIRAAHKVHAESESVTSGDRGSPAAATVLAVSRAEQTAVPKAAKDMSGLSLPFHRYAVVAAECLAMRQARHSMNKALGALAPLFRHLCSETQGVR
jgi:hypothetical protein